MLLGPIEIHEIMPSFQQNVRYYEIEKVEESKI